MSKSRLAIQVLGTCVLALNLSAVCYPQNGVGQLSAQTGGIKGSIILDDGSPCRHCAVSAESFREAGIKKRAWTDDAGNFLFVDLSPGSYMVTVDNPIIREPFGQGVNVSAGPPTVFRLDFSKGLRVHAVGNLGVVGEYAPGEIVGSVFSRNGDPCSSCAVIIEPTGRKYGVETDSGGNFRDPHLPAGYYKFTVRLPDGRTVETKGEGLRVDANQSSGIEIVLVPPGWPLTGTQPPGALAWNSNKFGDRFMATAIRIEAEPGRLKMSGESTPSVRSTAPPGPTETQTAASAINKILNGPHSTLPAPRAVGPAQGGQTLTTIANRTRYTLSIYFSGPSSYVLQIPREQARQLRLSPGQYQVGARVSDPSVIPFYGVHDYNAGTRYSEDFYIQSQSH